MRSIGQHLARAFGNTSLLPCLQTTIRGALGSLALIPFLLSAEPVAELDVPKKEGWTGQRIPLFIDLRAEGSFKGAPSFDLPEIPKTVIVKVDTPVISSETQGGEEFFIQRHEFALFSQTSGSLKIPPINARFSHLKGYTGPTYDAEVKTKPVTLSLDRPPNSDSIAFLVTTSSLEIEESWDPQPAPLETGAVLKRTITQRAEQMTGIALMPAPTPEIEGVRSYPGKAEVTDHTERGVFSGERRETITYLIQQPGLHTLPEIRFDWWNPTTQTLETKILPSVSFTATSPPPPPEKASRKGLLWLLLPVALIVLAFLFRNQIADKARALHALLDPPSNRARRHFLAACRQNDPTKARQCWENLRAFHPDTELAQDLKKELNELYRIEFGSSESSQNWTGEALAHAYKESTTEAHVPKSPSLPSLNP